MMRDDRPDDGTEDYDERCDGSESCDCDECGDVDYCLCGVYLDGEMNRRHATHPDLCTNCGDDRSDADDENAEPRDVCGATVGEDCPNDCAGRV